MMVGVSGKRELIQFPLVRLFQPRSVVENNDAVSHFGPKQLRSEATTRPPARGHDGKFFVLSSTHTTLILITLARCEVSRLVYSAILVTIRHEQIGG